MDIVHFIFSFLYVRNWHTGHQELSRPRVVVFFAALFLLLLAILIVSFLQMPVRYDVT